MKARTAVILVVGMLLVTGLACSQAGEILTPAEATARAQEASQPVVSGGGVEGSAFQSGDAATLTGRSFLVNLYNEPGGKVSAGQERGITITVLEVASLGEDTWYKIEAPTGQGWVPAANLEPVEGEETEIIEGPQPGDAVYLAGRSFLVNLLEEPGGKIIAGQERGMAITILEIVQYEDDTWYHIDAPTGQGWVPSANITTEAP